MSIEQVDIEKALAIGGATYNHSGQIIMAGMRDWLFLGDEYGEYSAMDSLVRNIMEHPKNWYVSDVVKIEDDSDGYLIVTMADGETESIRYEYRDCVVIVNHQTKYDVVKKSA
jgi:hypothetical protein